MVSLPSRQVTFSRQRFLQTYRHVALVLQLLSGIATTASFLRISEQYHLPVIFLALPSLLFVITAIGRCVPLKDVGITAIIVGAVTGAIAGFLSTVVGHQDADMTEKVSANRSNILTVLCSMEFLHIPVVVGAVMYTFCLLFTRLPPLTLIVIAAATAACGTVIFGLGLSIISDPMLATDSVPFGSGLTGMSVTLILTFLTVFVLALMPALRHNKRAWLLCITSLTLSVYWQSNFLDTVQWDWHHSYFPIPGALVGVVVLYMIEIVELSESADFTLRKSSSLSNRNADVVLTAVMWHIGAYVVERTSLTMILDSRRSSSRSDRHSGSSSDAWLCCLGMLGLLALFTPTASRELSLLQRLTLMCLGLLLYICLTATGPLLTNGYFLDDVLGIALFATTATTNFAAGSV